MLPATVTTSFEGQAKVFQQSMQNLGLLLFVAIGVVYIVLGALYESYVHPLTILSGLPSAGLGALITLDFLHSELNIYSFVGLVMLIGIVKKNAIMQIDFALEAERQRGKMPAEAIYEGCLIGFRPDHYDDDGGVAGMARSTRRDVERSTPSRAARLASASSGSVATTTVSVCRASRMRLPSAPPLVTVRVDDGQVRREVPEHVDGDVGRFAAGHLGDDAQERVEAPGIRVDEVRDRAPDDDARVRPRPRARHDLLRQGARRGDGRGDEVVGEVDDGIRPPTVRVPRQAGGVREGTDRSMSPIALPARQHGADGDLAARVRERVDDRVHDDGGRRRRRREADEDDRLAVCRGHESAHGLGERGGTSPHHDAGRGPARVGDSRGPHTSMKPARTTAGAGSSGGGGDPHDDAVAVAASHDPLDGHEDVELDAVLAREPAVDRLGRGGVGDDLGAALDDRGARVHVAATVARLDRDARVLAQPLELAGPLGGADDGGAGVGKHPHRGRDRLAVRR